MQKVLELVYEFYNRFINTGSLIQTILNLVYLSIILIIIILAVKSFFINYKITFESLSYSIFMFLFSGFVLMYRENTWGLPKNYGTVFVHFIYIPIFVVTVLISVLDLIKQLRKKPLNNGAAVVPDGNNSQVRLVGEDYKKYFAKKKVQDFFFMFFRDIAAIAILFPPFLKHIHFVFAWFYKLISSIKINFISNNNISVYAIILIVTIAIGSLIMLLLRKIKD